MPISHLLFADDLLIFGRVDENTNFKLREILDNCSEILDQKINEGNSRLTFSPNTFEEHKSLFQETINVRESENLGLYLGMPLGHKHPKKNDLKFVMNKVREKIVLVENQIALESQKVYPNQINHENYCILLYASFSFAQINSSRSR